MNAQRKFPPNDPVKAFRHAQRALYGDMIKDKKTALAVAEVLIRYNFKEDVLKEQQPLSVTEDDDMWVIKGSLTEDPSKSLKGPVVVKLKKEDAAVVSFYLSLNRPPYPEPPAAVRNGRKRK